MMAVLQGHQAATHADDPPTGPCRRQPIAVELVADGRPFGQIAEALVTIGDELF